MGDLPEAPSAGKTQEARSRPRPDTVHLSFSGGEARGYAHIGCLQAVERLGLRVTEVSGTSIGAMVAALFAAGHSAAEIQHLGTTLRRREFLRYDWPEVRALVNLFRPRAHRKPAGIWSLEPYYRTVSRLLRRARFRDLRLPCYVQVTDLSNLRPLIFSREFDPFMEVAFAVKASAAYPGVMAPAEWGGLTLADGGAFVDLGALPIRARRIIVSNVSSHGYEREAISSLPRVLGAYLRFRERALVPPRSVRGTPVTVISYAATLSGLKPFRRPTAEAARRIIAEACGTALAALAGERPSHAP